MTKILVVEDSVSQAAIIAEIVRKAGHEPVICKEITKSLPLTITSLVPELVLLDLVLLGSDGKPVVDGFQVCKEVKRISNNGIKIVVVSSRDDDESTEWAKLQGADAFLRKPFRVEELLVVINDVMEAK